MTTPVTGRARPQVDNGVTVLIVDDQPLLRTGFRMILGSDPGINVVGEAGDGAHRDHRDRTIATRRGPDGRPDARHWTASRPPGASSLRRAARRILILTTFDLDEYAFSALAAGASGFLLKDVPPAELIAAIHAIATGDAVVSPRITRQLLDRYSGQLPDH